MNAKTRERKRQEARILFFALISFLLPIPSPPLIPPPQRPSAHRRCRSGNYFESVCDTKKIGPKSEAAGEIKVCRSLHMTKKCISQVLPPASPLFHKCLNYRISRLQILRKRGGGGAEKTSRQIRINLGLTRSKHTHHIHTHACRIFSKQIPPPSSLVVVN